MGIPLFVPSPKLLSSLNLIDDNDCNGMHSMSGTHPQKHEDTVHGNRSPESHSPEDVQYWLQFTMYYQWPHITTFDSWKQLMQLLSAAFTEGNTFLYDIHMKMMKFNAQREAVAVNTWSDLIRNISVHDNGQLRNIPEDYQTAIKSIYGLERIQID